MKVIGFNGSARKDGNTAILINYVFGELKKERIDTELVQLAGKNIKGCTACMKCSQTKDMRCVIKNDLLNEYLEKMVAADGIILGAPTYITGIPSNMQAFIERASLVSRANGGFLRRKAGAAVVAARRAGAIHAYDTLNHFFHLNQMIVPGSIYWNIGIGREKGEVEKDPEGIETMKVLGQNMAWLLKKLRK